MIQFFSTKVVKSPFGVLTIYKMSDFALFILEFLYSLYFHLNTAIQEKFLFDIVFSSSVIIKSNQISELENHHLVEDSRKLCLIGQHVTCPSCKLNVFVYNTNRNVLWCLYNTKLPLSLSLYDPGNNKDTALMSTLVRGHCPHLHFKCSNFAALRFTLLQLSRLVFGIRRTTLIPR